MHQEAEITTAPSPESPLSAEATGSADPLEEAFPLDLETATVAELNELLAADRITSVSLTRAYLGRIEALDAGAPALNSVRCLNPRALDEASAADLRRREGGPHGPLLGIPVLVKDNIDVAGLPNTAGSPALAHSVPAQDAPLVARLRAAGAVILGKANLTEFANYLTSGMPSGYSSLAGQVLNPYDASCTPSGSSAGSGVAAAMGFAAVTIGTETSGSILSPAVANSAVGIKPTIGLVSRTGVVPIASSQDTAGPMARSVADAAALLTVLCGMEPEDQATSANPLAGHDFTADLSQTALRGARIGVVADQVPATGSDERALWDDALTALAARGATLVDVQLLVSRTFQGGSTVLDYEFKRDLNAYLSRAPEGAEVRSLADLIAYNNAHADRTLKFGQTHALDAEAKDLAQDSADTIRYQADRAQDLVDSKDQIDAVLAEHDLTALLFANAGGADIGARAGYPSVTVPAGYLAANRRPFGISLLGPAWSEPALVGYAHDFEQATQLRRPPSVVNPTLFSRCRPVTSPTAA